MPRDYAKKHRTQPDKRPLPGWVWMLGGLSIGLFIAFLVYLNNLEGGKPRQVETPAARATQQDTRGVRTPKTEAPPTASVAKAANQQPAASQPPKLNYDFYNILPEFEVTVPKEESSVETKTEPKKVETPGVYLLQAGSFKNMKEADSRRAELALLGVISSVQTVTIDGRQTWHRVRIGPYRDLEDLNKVRTLLGNNGIDHMLLKERS